MPLSEKAVREAEQEHVVKAPVRRACGRSSPVRPESHRRAAGSHARLLRDLLERRLVEGRADPLKSPDAVRRVIETLATQHPNADTELHYTQRVRVARRDDPLCPVDGRAGQHGHAGALQEIPGRADARRAQSRPLSRSRSFPPASFGRRRSRCSEWRTRW